MSRHPGSVTNRSNAPNNCELTLIQHHQCDQPTKKDAPSARAISKASHDSSNPPTVSLPSPTAEENCLLARAANVARQNRRVVPARRAPTKGKHQSPHAEHLHSSSRGRALEYLSRSHRSGLGVPVIPPRRSSLQPHHETLAENRWSWESALSRDGLTTRCDAMLGAVDNEGHDDAESGLDGWFFLWQEYDARRRSRCIREFTRSTEELVRPEEFVVEL